ncbi:MAG: MFS family permease, partial [Maribacter sp.]
MKGLKLTILLLSMLTMMAAAIIAPSLPAISLHFNHISQVELLSKLILSLPALFIVMIAPFAGNYIDRFGRLKLLYIGLLGYVISGTSGYFLQDLYMILVGRMFLGISIGIIMTIVMTLVGDYFEGEARRKFVGYQSAFIGLAGVFFMIIGGYLASQHWRLPFMIYLFPLVLIPMCFFFLKEPKTIHRSTFEPLPTSSPLLKVLFPIGTFFMILFYLMPTQLPFLLKDMGIEIPSYSGNALATNALGIVCTSFFYSNIKKRFSFLVVASAALLMVGTGYFLTGISTTFETVLASVFLAGLGSGLFMANLTFWVMELSPPQVRGKNMGILTACLFLGQFLSPIVAEPI